MNPIEEFSSSLNSKLEERRTSGLLRSLVCLNGVVDFSSNDYLGFSARSEFKGLDADVPSGATGSRLIAGNSRLAEETEECIASFHGAGSALIFQSGYAANLGLLSCIAFRGDTFVADEYVHASMIDGMRLSPASRFRFRHNDVDDLRRKLNQATGRRIVVIESLYSMHGDRAPLREIADVCDQCGAVLVVDEAHATGVYGERGEGLVAAEGLSNRVFACVFTFGKALGLHGAAVTGSTSLRNYLINFARPFIYSTGLPPQVYRQVQMAYRLLPSADRESLFRNVLHFRRKMSELTEVPFISGDSPIQGIVIGNNERATELASHLLRKGFYSKAILSPTVPPGSERLRICLHSFNTAEEIDLFLKEVSIFLA